MRLVEIFQLAEEHGLEVHPETMRMATRDVKAIDHDVRDDPRANALFLKLLTGRNDPENVLRWMNEAGVFGRFVPDFGKVGAQMQFDMYHHYTVDEHTIRAIGLLAAIERGELSKDHPLATEIIPQLASRRVLYVATLAARYRQGPRRRPLGARRRSGARAVPALRARARTRPSWSAGWSAAHLLMSATAFKRDLADPKTIIDFVAEVESLERLRQLLVLTVVDIRAVGPGIWNCWKRQLLGDLYELAVEQLRLGPQAPRAGRARGRQEAPRGRIARRQGRA